MKVTRDPKSQRSSDSFFKQVTFEIKKEDKFEIVFVGDTSFGENYQQLIKENGGKSILDKGYNYPLEKVKTILMDADFVVANLETTVSNIKKSPFFGKKEYIHWSDVKKTPKYLFEHNIRCVNLANNHSFDYGEDGLKQTTQSLKAQGIEFFGAGLNIEEAGKPFLIKMIHNAKTYHVAIIGAFESSKRYREKYNVYAGNNKSGIQMLNFENISKQILNINKQYPEAILILSPHWGMNYKWRTIEQKNMAELLIRHGADLIVGHGSHMFQEIENIDNRWVLYSIGNFMFNSPGRYNKDAPGFGLVVKLIFCFSETLQISLRLYPILTNNRITKYQSRPVTDLEFHDFCQILNLKSSHLAYNYEISKDKIGNFLELPFKTFDKSSTEKVKAHSMQCVGMLCNVHLQQDLTDKYTPWICRSWVMDKAFKKENLQLFMYSPRDVDPSSGMAKGYCIENNKFILKELEIPSVNYDWYMGSKPDNDLSMSYSDFFKWAQNRGILIFPIKKMANIAASKYESYLLLKKHNTTIQPESKRYSQDDTAVLSDFFDKNNLVFLKPNHGNHGEGIITIEKGVNKRGLNYYLFNHYMGTERQEIYCKSWKKLVNVLRDRISNHSYVIQTGVKSLRYNGSAFNIRVITVHDGVAWQWVHEVRASTHFSAISTYPFLGMSYPLKSFLSNILSEESVNKLIEDLRSISFDIIQYLDSLYPEEVGEVAFDFVVDENCKIYLAEINTKPGIIGDPNVLQDFFNASFYGEQTELYTTYLAKLFKKKLSDSTFLSGK